MIKIKIPDGRKIKPSKLLDPLFTLYKYAISQIYPNWALFHKTLADFMESKNLSVSNFYMNRHYYNNEIRPKVVKYYLKNGQLLGRSNRAIKSHLVFYNLSYAPNFGEYLEEELEPGYIYVDPT